MLLCGLMLEIGALKNENFGPLFISTSGTFEYCVRCISKFKYISRLRVLSSS